MLLFSPAEIACNLQVSLCFSTLFSFKHITLFFRFKCEAAIYINKKWHDNKWNINTRTVATLSPQWRLHIRGGDRRRAGRR